MGKLRSLNRQVEDSETKDTSCESQELFDLMMMGIRGDAIGGSITLGPTAWVKLVEIALTHQIIPLGKLPQKRGSIKKEGKEEDMLKKMVGE